MTKKLTAIALALAVLVLFAAGASGSENPNPNTAGNLTFLLDWDGEPLEGGSVTLYRVANLALVEGEYHFVLVSQLEDSGLTLKKLEDPALTQSLLDLKEETKLTSVTAPIVGGKAEFTDLRPGVFLVVQEEPTEGFAPMNSFLISFPQWRDGHYVYDLTLEPKVALETEPTEPTETEPTEPTTPPDPNLPQTGQLNWPVPVLSVSGLALFALGWYLTHGKREHHEN